MLTPKRKGRCKGIIPVYHAMILPSFRWVERHHLHQLSIVVFSAAPWLRCVTPVAGRDVTWRQICVKPGSLPPGGRSRTPGVIHLRLSQTVGTAPNAIRSAGCRDRENVSNLFAFLDDHPRAVVGHRWSFAENTVRLAAARRPAPAARLRRRRRPQPSRGTRCPFPRPPPAHGCGARTRRRTKRSGGHRRSR